jgi:hypothetical protein
LTDPAAPHSGVDRRGVLAGGLAGVAGLGVGGAGGWALGRAHRGALPSAGRLEYGPAPSGGDDTARLQDAVDAMPHGGLLILPPGAYRLGLPLVVPPGVHLAGSGGFPLAASAGTSLVCSGRRSGVWFRGGSNGARDVAVVGGGEAAVLVGGTGSRDAGADCYFANVSVRDAAADGWVLQGVQNSTFVNCRVHSARGDGLVLDYSAGGHLFQRFESAGSGGANLRIRQSRRALAGGYPIPADNTFLACIFEQRATPGPSVVLEQLDSTSFVHCAVSSTPGSAGDDASALVEVRAGRVEFVSPVVYVEGAGRVGFAVRGAGTRVAVSGLAQIAGGGGAFAAVDEGAVLLLDAAVLGLHEDTPTVGTVLLSPGTSPSRVYATRPASLAVAQDVSARRHLSPPAVTTPTTDGPLHLDAAAGDRQLVLLDRRAVTGLTIANAVEGQSLTLVLVQGAPASRVELSGGGVHWSGGDAHPPTLTSPGGYLAVELVRLRGQWFELSRAGTDVR